MWRELDAGAANGKRRWYVFRDSGGVCTSQAWRTVAPVPAGRVDALADRTRS